MNVFFRNGHHRVVRFNRRGGIVIHWVKPGKPFVAPK